jgi:hypothetical protein
MRSPQTALMLLRRRLNAFIARCHALIGSVCDPYRPELHYMRGPGPKWPPSMSSVPGATRSPSSRQQLVEQKARLKAGLFVH